MTAFKTTEQLGNLVRNARKSLNLTQPQLAMAAGVGLRFIVDLEAGKPTLRLSLVLRVIDALGGTILVTGLPTESESHGKEVTNGA